MSTYATLDGAYVGNQPGTKKVYHEPNRPGAPGAWEEITITKRGPYYDVDFTGDHRKDALCLNEQSREPEVRASRGDWGDQWNLDEVKKTLWIGDSRGTVTLQLEGYGSGTGPSEPAESFTIRGRDFITPAGKRRTLRGCDAFMAFRIFIDQGEAGLMTFIQESLRLGFDLWRVFFQGSIKQNQVMELHPREYTPDQIRAFGVLLNKWGIIPLATCFIDNQDVGSTFDQWYNLTDALEGLVALASGANEIPKNMGALDYRLLPKPRGKIYWSRGSWTGDPPQYLPLPDGASFAEFHPNRDPVRGLMDATASPLTVAYEYKISIPFIVDEPARFGTNGHAPEFADPAWARQYGQVYGAMNAGTVFHNYFGQRGLTMDEPTISVANAWQAGTRM